MKVTKEDFIKRYLTLIERKLINHLSPEAHDSEHMDKANEVIVKHNDTILEAFGLRRG